MDGAGLRTHTFTWRDHATAAFARELTGRAYLEGLHDGTIPPPPFVALLGLQLTEIGDGRVVFSFEPHEYMHNGIGLVHGGIAATVFDTAIGCACLTVVPADKVAVTMDLQVRYFKPLTLASGTIRCEATIVHAGRMTVTGEARLTDAAGRLCGQATSTLALVAAVVSR